MKRRAGITAGFLGLMIAGCGGAGDPIDRFMAQVEALADVTCQCPSLAGASTEAQCRETVSINSFTAAQEMCVRNVYSQYESEIRPTLDCQFNAQRELTDCIRPIAEACAEGATATECAQRFAAATEACPSGSAAADAAFQACFDSGS